jgi:hypothetical protein
MEQGITPNRLLFAAFVIWGAMIFWIAPHPPMVDFPQHAAQISLLKDLLTGHSPWAAHLQINLVTPYLIGYGLASLLSFVMPVVVAMKLLLSIAYISFVAVSVAFRKRVSADARLDWIFIPTFFGFCYSWGMFTFLLAAPIGLIFILLADRYANALAARSGVLVLLAGLLLLISHGLTFVLGWGTGVALLTMRLPRRWTAASLYFPYIVLLFAGIIFYKSGKQIDATIIQTPVPFEYGSNLLVRLMEAGQFPFSFDMKIGSDLSLIPVVLAIAIAPFLLGLRLNRRDPAAWVPFACVCVLFFTLPSITDNTALLYPRYSLFLLPTYVWLFTAQGAKNHPTFKAKLFSPASAQCILIIACIFILGSTSGMAWHFRQETRAFDAQIGKLSHGERALGLVFNAGSEAAKSFVVYLHYPAWYQAEKKGLTDFNFAWFTPQVVRFRPGASPPVSIGFEWMKHQGASYRYFFVRGEHDPIRLFKGAPCQPKVVVSADLWKVYENCSASANVHSG